MVDLAAGLLGGLAGIGEGMVAMSLQQQKILADQLRIDAEEAMRKRLFSHELEEKERRGLLDQWTVTSLQGKDGKMHSVMINPRTNEQRDLGLVKDEEEAKKNLFKSELDEKEKRGLLGNTDYRDFLNPDGTKETWLINKGTGEKIKSMGPSTSAKEIKTAKEGDYYWTGTEFKQIGKTIMKPSDMKTNLASLLIPFMGGKGFALDQDGNFTTEAANGYDIAQRIVSKNEKDLTPDEKRQLPNARRLVSKFEEYSKAIAGDKDKTPQQNFISAAMGQSDRSVVRDWKNLQQGQNAARDQTIPGHAPTPPTAGAGTPSGQVATPGVQPPTTQSRINPSQRGVPVQNTEGTFSSERTITVGIDDKFYVIPTLINGKPYTAEEAVRLFNSGGIQAVAVADTAEEANRQAVERSKALGLERPGALQSGQEILRKMEEKHREETAPVKKAVGGLLGKAWDTAMEIEGGRPLKDLPGRIGEPVIKPESTTPNPIAQELAKPARTAEKTEIPARLKTAKERLFYKEGKRLYDMIINGTLNRVDLLPLEEKRLQFYLEELKKDKTGR